MMWALSTSTLEHGGNMRLVIALLVLFSCLVFPFSVSAEIYKWVDKEGTVHFTDSPPPSSAQAEVVNPEPNRVEGYGKISENRERPNLDELTTKKKSRNLPTVELYVTSWCGYCKKAEAWFKNHNIPFVKYDVEKDKAAARRKASMTSSSGVPFVLIGDVGIPGYSEVAFEQALDKYR
ncbi:MAG: hypothetical protein C0615_00700 [Desulfuromonas sp.]|nr:MAG: hypothetical protein C0615_00700 [Desulfuromonas sp.]